MALITICVRSSFPPRQSDPPPIRQRLQRPLDHQRQPTPPPALPPRYPERIFEHDQLGHPSVLHSPQTLTRNRSPGPHYFAPPRRPSIPLFPESPSSHYDTALPTNATPPPVNPRHSRRVNVEHSPPTNVRRPTFDCGVCLETHAENHIIFIEPCRHPFCRDCIRSYISSKLRERNCSMTCPTCATQSNRRPSGTLFSIVKWISAASYPN
jgi:hypothetical protein